LSFLLISYAARFSLPFGDLCPLQAETPMPSCISKNVTEYHQKHRLKNTICG
jgi:hypothetical protein